MKFAVCVSVMTLVVVTNNVPATPTGSVPNHVLTWSSDAGDGGQTDGTNEWGTNPASKRHIQTWVSFAEMGTGKNHVPLKAYYDCGAPGSPCKIVFYFNPGKLYANCWPASDFISQNTTEDYYLHDSVPISSSNRTTSHSKICNDTPVYYPNWNNPAVGQWFARYFLWPIPENNNTIMFADDSGAKCEWHFHPRETYAPYELRGGASCDASIAAGLRNLANQMRWKDGTPVPVIVNGFAVAPETRVANLSAVALAAPGSQILGGVSEAPAFLHTRYRPRGVFGDVNTASLIYAENPNALYVFLGDTNSAAPGSTQPCTDSADNKEDGCGNLQQRRNMLAEFWLGYKEEQSVVWHGHGRDRHIITVYPEASIYPRNPVQELKRFNPQVATTDGSGCGPQPGSGGIQSFVVACGTLNDGKTPAGVYVREFRQCYNFGQLIGAGQCAVVMNTTNRAVTVINNWFTQSYTHAMVLGSGPTDGADVLTAGCDNSQCPKSAIDPLGATLVVGKTQVPAFDALFLFHN